MNIWTIVAVFAALVFGFCNGYIVAIIKERKHVKKLIGLCEETSEELRKLSTEYDDFIKAANDVDRWPKHDPHITMKDDLADYLKSKYLSVDDVDDRDPNCDNDDNDGDDEYAEYI